MNARKHKNIFLPFALFLSITCFAQSKCIESSDESDVILLSSRLKKISPKVRFVPTTVSEDLPKCYLVTNRIKTFQAFTVLQSLRKTEFGTSVIDRILFFDVRRNQLYEIRGLPREDRPYDSLKTIGGDVLQFDHWESPHYGIRYKVNLRQKKITSAWSFLESEYVERQKEVQRQKQKKH